ncbi:MAG: GH3 auxin-responsive promoter family protein [Bacteroidota bacterium]|nr:GH3 auxin-responsive promoter family protein [Bacteroidota bacterium]
MIKKIGAKILAKFIHHKNQKWIRNPLLAQQKTFDFLIQKAKSTDFGREHGFNKIKDYKDFQASVPIRDYEGHRVYVDKMLEGATSVLWPGKPLYYAKTSGTTSGVKYIPLTKDSMPTHITAARDALLNYIYETGKTNFVNGKQIFLQGSPTLKSKNRNVIGRLSGIVAHYVPKYLQKNRMPSWETNCIEDWETKVDAIVRETLTENMSLIAGIPSWVQMYFEKLIEKTGIPVGNTFPDFSLFVYGGVNYEPYRPLFEKLVGRKLDSIELFPASEGFFAYQDQQNDKGLLLLLNNQIFYEFIKADEFGEQNQKRHTLGEVELNVNYVLILSTSAGLWAYNIGDTVCFVSLEPYRLVVTGRIKHFISAFGEHVIGKEVETAMQQACQESDVQVKEFTVAPKIDPEEGLPYHEWFIEFENPPQDTENLAQKLDQSMQEQNVYYEDLLKGSVLRTLVITTVADGGFQQYMKSIGKLGGQNKVPRLSNDRKIVDKLPLK